MPFDQLFSALDEKKIDAMMSAISITSEREKKFAFSIPYFSSTVSFITRKDHPLDLNQLQDVAVGVGKGSTFYNYIQATYGNAVTIKTYDKPDEDIADLAEGRIDLILLDTPDAKYWVDNSAGQFVFVGKPMDDPKFFGTGFGIGVRQDNVTLLNAINIALMNMQKDGTYAAIKKNYF